MVIDQLEASKLIRELRLLTGLTQEQFAAQLGVTYPTINRWENGRVTPSPLALKQIEGMLRELGEIAKDLLAKYFPDDVKGEFPILVISHSH